jgi:hypothetical protein
MSRTDVHAPYRVKLCDPEWQKYVYEEHDHDDGTCDIDHFDPGDWQATHCHRGMIWFGRNIHCGCNLCTGHYWVRFARRRERVAVRAVCREAVKLADREDVDVWVPWKGWW